MRRAVADVEGTQEVMVGIAAEEFPLKLLGGPTGGCGRFCCYPGASLFGAIYSRQSGAERAFEAAAGQVGAVECVLDLFAQLRARGLGAGRAGQYIAEEAAVGLGSPAPAAVGPAACGPAGRRCRRPRHPARRAGRSRSGARYAVADSIVVFVEQIFAAADMERREDGDCDIIDGIGSHWPPSEGLSGPRPEPGRNATRDGVCGRSSPCLVAAGRRLCRPQEGTAKRSGCLQPESRSVGGAGRRRAANVPNPNANQIVGGSFVIQAVRDICFRWQVTAQEPGDASWSGSGR